MSSKRKSDVAAGMAVLLFVTTIVLLIYALFGEPSRSKVIAVAGCFVGYVAARAFCRKYTEDFAEQERHLATMLLLHFGVTAPQILTTLFIYPLNPGARQSLHELLSGVASDEQIFTFFREREPTFDAAVAGCSTPESELALQQVQSVRMFRNFVSG